MMIRRVLSYATLAVVGSIPAAEAQFGVMPGMPPGVAPHRRPWLAAGLPTAAGAGRRVLEERHRHPRRQRRGGRPAPGAQSGGACKLFEV